MLSDFQRRRELATHLRAELQIADSTKMFMCYQPVHHLQRDDMLGVKRYYAGNTRCLVLWRLRKLLISPKSMGWVMR